jgi:hypothetical protein
MWKVWNSLVPVFLVIIGQFANSADQLLPQIQLSDLQSSDLFENVDILNDNGGQLGAFVVTGLDQDYLSAVKEFRTRAPDCLKQHDHLPSLEMNDGSTRTTFATMTGDNSQTPGCLKDEINVMSATFDVIDNHVAKLIQIIANGNQPLQYQDKSQKHFDLKDGPIKTHIHVYSQDNLGAPKITKVL